ncbi:hypothetical protein [Haloarchaeobius sp. TZWWS8]|uniref:hypothetical protein n=1 Tax=Haloarchaeobius sp. TZWWS8 TaxID=3446121 RepID=UPI003EC10B22
MVDDDESMPTLEDTPEPIPRGVVGRLRYHVHTWPRRFVEMQVRAIGGRTR